MSSVPLFDATIEPDEDPSLSLPTGNIGASTTAGRSAQAQAARKETLVPGTRSDGSYIAGGGSSGGGGGGNAGDAEMGIVSGFSFGPDVIVKHLYLSTVLVWISFFPVGIFLSSSPATNISTPLPSFLFVFSFFLFVDSSWHSISSTVLFCQFQSTGLYPLLVRSPIFVSSKNSDLGRASGKPCVDRGIERESSNHDSLLTGFPFFSLPSFLYLRRLAFFYR